MNNNKPLIAFYDLAVSPVTFDFFHFILSAEIARKKQNLGAIHVVIVPSSEEFQDIDLKDRFQEADREWRLRNIILPGCLLLPSCQQYTLCRTRDEANWLEPEESDHIFPENYSPKSPKACFHSAELVAHHLTGTSIPQLQPTKMSVEFVREWKEAHAGGKSIITLSLRQTNYGLQRNSNLSAWVEFAHYLEKKSYFPVFVRDTYDVFRGMPTELKGFTCLDAASINLEIRMAIYSKSAAVLGNTSGPTVLCWFGGVPCLAFKSVEPTWHDTHPQSIKSSLGIEVGTQPPFLSSNQRYIWEDTDSFDTIVSAFEEIEPSLDTPPPITAPPPTDLNSPEQFQSLSDFSRDLIDAHSYRAARIVLLALLEQEPKNASYQHKMGIVFTRMQCFDEAKIKLDSAAALDDENADIRVSIGDLHLMLGNTSEASSAFNLAIELNPKCSNGYLRLGLIMERSGLSGQAVLLFEKALEVAPKNAQAMRLLANCYNEVGLKDKANTLLDHANLVDPKNEGDSL